MPISGWKYFKLGQCADCSEAGARLFVPVLEGKKYEGYDHLVNGDHIPHFDPVCSTCKNKYLLDMICSEHRLPVTADAKCKLCLPKNANIWAKR